MFIFGHFFLIQYFRGIFGVKILSKLRAFIILRFYWQKILGPIDWPIRCRLFYSQFIDDFQSEIILIFSGTVCLVQISACLEPSVGKDSNLPGNILICSLNQSLRHNTALSWSRSCCDSLAVFFYLQST